MGDGEELKTAMINPALADGMQCTLTVVLPSGQESRHVMRKMSLLVGRSEQCDIVIKDGSVSSRHCEVAKEHGKILIRDLGSSNGLVIGGKKVQESDLFDGDVVKIGQTMLKVSIEGGARRPGGGRSAPSSGVSDGSTAFLGAGQLEEMQQAPPPRRPMREPPPEPQGSDAAAWIKLFITLIVVGAVVGGGIYLYMKRVYRARDRDAAATMARAIEATLTSTPCGLVQDKVHSLAKLDNQVTDVRLQWPPPRPNPTGYSRYVKMLKEKMTEYQRIMDALNNYVAQQKVALETVKATSAGLNQKKVVEAGEEAVKVMEDRIAQSDAFIRDWRKLHSETEQYADTVDGLFNEGRSSLASEFQNFQFSKGAPEVIAACRRNFDRVKQQAMEKSAALKKEAGVTEEAAQ
jgi:hypothetical protein